MQIYYVYMLECSDGKYYIGLTSNLEKRLGEHNSGAYRNSFTSYRLPVKLIGYVEFPDYFQAKLWESKFKGWRREKKEAFFNEQYENLPYLSQRKEE